MQRVKLMGINSILLFFLLLLSSLTVSLAGTTSCRRHSTSRENPFTPKASLIRYWNKHISNNNFPNPTNPPHFLLSKASPLSAAQSAFFSKLATQKSLPHHLSSFCSAAHLLCLSDSAATSPTKPHQDANFTSYSNKHFSNYGTARLGGADTFKNYSGGINFATDSFSKYSLTSTGHNEDFQNYVENGNVAGTNFSSYASATTGGSGDFKNYHSNVNVPDLGFTGYDSDSNNHNLSFSTYTEDTNSGNQAFISYSKNGNGVPVEFSRYGISSNTLGSTFNRYGVMGNGGNDSFKVYASNSNNPNNNFKTYGENGNSATDSFSSYRDGANTGTDTFQSYAKNSDLGKERFLNYGRTFSGGTDSFKEYGKGSVGQSIEFKVYGINTFKEYAQKGVTFAQYMKNSSPSAKVSGISVNKWVEPGKFFREDMLREGNVMEMPDIRDKMPKRSFLPRGISSKLPFSMSELRELKRIFHARDKSAVERVLVNALAECERSPSRDETKRCVGSAEDMIDFAVEVLGSNVEARTTENVEGSKRSVMIGEVRGIDGGRVTKSVSCHQSLYPYLLYYCHSVPKVRVHVADILDVATKVKINSGVAICHLDTSAWSPGHGAFVALGSGPGLIEVCHWIFENDMTWTVAD